jgi:hypothetical protein
MEEEEVLLVVVVEKLIEEGMAARVLLRCLGRRKILAWTEPVLCHKVLLKEVPWKSS